MEDGLVHLPGGVAASAFLGVELQIWLCAKTYSSSVASFLRPAADFESKPLFAMSSRPYCLPRFCRVTGIERTSSSGKQQQKPRQELLRDWVTVCWPMVASTLTTLPKRAEIDRARFKLCILSTPICKIQFASWGNCTTCSRLRSCLRCNKRAIPFSCL
jgi:hypothetical protein